MSTSCANFASSASPVAARLLSSTSRNQCAKERQVAGRGVRKARPRHGAAADLQARQAVPSVAQLSQSVALDMANGRAPCAASTQALHALVRTSRGPPHAAAAGGQFQEFLSLRITVSACKNQLVVVSVQYGPFNPYISIISTTIGKSRVAIDPIAMHTSWRSNSDIASVTSIGYPRMSASGESSTTMHRLLNASGSHPIPTPDDPKPQCKMTVLPLNIGKSDLTSVDFLGSRTPKPLRITDSACKNQWVVVSVQYGPFNPYIPIRSTTIGKSRVAIDPIAMHTSWRSNSDIASVTSIGYPRMSASGESSTTMHRLLNASGSHPIPTPDDPKCTGDEWVAPMCSVYPWPRTVCCSFDQTLLLSSLLVQPDEGVSDLVVDRIGDNLPQSIEKSRILVIPVGARHKCQQESRRKRSRSSDWNRRRTRRLPTTRMNARGTCALAAHGWAPPLAIIARWCAAAGRDARAALRYLSPGRTFLVCWPTLVRRARARDGGAGRRCARGVALRCVSRDGARAAAAFFVVAAPPSPAVAPPPFWLVSGDVVTAGLNSSRVWFGPVPGSP
ncbi:BTB/POZ domain-containing protein-like [Dorcoceras hygrometricum]|uniref:BTB/POZ domain-containing protein-like n=1 Tax=Dorcoceras hygrometricum TaxID=472368 RepID=A0A2Z7D063_9LAMI|nr:BTB/POZ domain-containing protein-like [Dorcoceras hygrometricum]